MKKIYFALAVLSLLNSKIFAQQNPHYTQYMYNMNVVNPAYAGSKETLSGGLLYRQQWAGLEGAPKTATLALHSPIGKNVGLGISAISDKIGPIEENNFYADFSYKLNLGGNHRLSFGLKAGATFQKVGLFSEIGNGYIQQAGDISFRQDANNTFLNIGAGIFYHTNKYYAAFSVPNMLDQNYLDITNNGQVYQFGSTKQHYFFTGGYVFDLSSNTKFKPSFMMKSAFNAPISFDFSANFLFFEKFEIGGTYRLDDSMGAMINYAITPSIRLGYAYDHVLSDLKVTTTASHEFMLLFDLNFSKKVSVSPRFF
ncbi:type IX secretion system PorP/SprF family membrane protein [Flavobacterium croceum DSM 17960]|uniref:Type IX secretion system PorP/SprF family membrane protein n=1 Tax=Flavobacterium croceum DSM 17960 TaxID=1121886 RepID=A0A2S4N6S3_9FLAO|nr:type IX secretion system membrane protein PorP/SprF [Flavobacterium croceum]POS01415.1 type IX secretion system PorP/SprF family membrane protein [Flavobacterium croceum DSM 17960]